MTDPVVNVTVAETPVLVSIDTHTPVISITDNNNPSGSVIINAQAVKVVNVNQRPIVKINLGGGGPMDQEALLVALEGVLDIGQLTPEMQSDMVLLQSLWDKVGRAVDGILTDADVDVINATSITYTDQKIELTAQQFARVDGLIEANESQITQTANQIGLRVTALDYETAENLAARDARMDLSENGIALAVSRLGIVDGQISTTNAAIALTADRITQEVVARETLENGIVAETSTRSIQTAEALISIAQSTNEVTGWKSTAEDRMTANERVISVLSEGLADGGYALQTVMALTRNSYGVVIEETVDGIPYTSGFEVLLHPEWQLTFAYVVDDTIEFTDDLIYKCILDHTSSTTNSPGGVDADTYWIELPEGTKTAFNVKADHFHVITPSGLVPLFSVDGTTGNVTVNKALVVDSIKSSDYDEQDPTKTWFSLNADTGLAEFNNIKMTFSGDTDKQDAQDALGITPDYLLDWEGTQSIKSSSDFANADEWIFDSPLPDGAMIQIEVDDAYAGDLILALNGSTVTAEVFPNMDFGGYATAGALGDETNIERNLDLSASGANYDLGGLA